MDLELRIHHVKSDEINLFVEVIQLFEDGATYAQQRHMEWQTAFG